MLSVCIPFSWKLKNISKTLRKMQWFYLIFWCGNFVERQRFHIVLGDSPETMRKLCLSTKFPHQEIRWKYGILCTEIILFHLLWLYCSSSFHFEVNHIECLLTFFSWGKDSSWSAFTISIWVGILLNIK